MPFSRPAEGCSAVSKFAGQIIMAEHKNIKLISRVIVNPLQSMGIAELFWALFFVLPSFLCFKFKRFHESIAPNMIGASGELL